MAGGIRDEAQRRQAAPQECRCSLGRQKPSMMVRPGPDPRSTPGMDGVSSPTSLGSGNRKPLLLRYHRVRRSGREAEVHVGQDERRSRRRPGQSCTRGNPSRRPLSASDVTVSSTSVQIPCSERQLLLGWRYWRAAGRVPCASAYGRSLVLCSLTLWEKPGPAVYARTPGAPQKQA